MQLSDVQLEGYQVFLNRGLELIDLGKYEEVIVACNQELQVNPDGHKAR